MEIFCKYSIFFSFLKTIPNDKCRLYIIFNIFSTGCLSVSCTRQKLPERMPAQCVQTYCSGSLFYADAMFQKPKISSVVMYLTGPSFSNALVSSSSLLPRMKRLRGLPTMFLRSKLTMSARVSFGRAS